MRIVLAVSLIIACSPAAERSATSAPDAGAFGAGTLERSFVIPGLVRARLEGPSLFLDPVGQEDFRQSLEVRVVGFGCGDGTEVELNTPEFAPLAGGGTRVSMGPMASWYRVRRTGIEQGFTIDDPACVDRSGTLRITMVVPGAEVHVASSGRAATLRTASGELWTYSGLMVADATGRELPARLRGEFGRLSVEVEAAGAAYPITVDPVFQLRSPLLRPSGVSVGAGAAPSSLAVDGTTIAVGRQVPGDVLVFDRGATGWSESQAITPPAGTDTLPFALRIALSGDTLAVGHIGDDEAATNSGAVYVYVRSGGVWSLEQKLTAPDVVAEQDFGVRLDVDGDNLVVHANLGGGADMMDRVVYAFHRTSGVWSFESRLGPYDGTGTLSGNLAVSGDTAVLGTRPGASVWIRSGSSWVGQQRIDPAATATRDFTDLAIDGDTILLGQYLMDSRAGRVAIFQRSGTTWTEVGEIRSPSPAATEQFGQGVDMSGSSVVVTSTGSREVHFFELAGTSATLVNEVTEADVAAGYRIASPYPAVSPSAAVLTAADLAVDPPRLVYPLDFLMLDGEACTLASDCVSGFCVDGFCCESACTGGCQSCSLAGAEGSCATLPAGFTCRDGAGGCDVVEVCDGASTTCPADQLAAAGAAGDPSCSPYLCGGDAASCPSTCATADDCVAGRVCVDGACVIPDVDAGTGDADGGMSVGDGGVTDRDGGSSGMPDAGSTADADGGPAGDPDGGTPLDGGADMGEGDGGSGDDGCGCRISGAPPRTPVRGWLLALPALALLIRRRS